MKRFGRRSRFLISSITVIALAAGCQEVVSFSHVHRDNGMAMYQERRLEDAAGAFRRTTRMNPRDYVSFFMLGECHAEMGHELEAVRAYRASLDVMKATYEGRKDEDFRQKVITRYAQFVAGAQIRDVELDAMARRARLTNDPTDWTALAQAYRYAGDADGAIDAFNQALIQSPRDQKLAKTYGLYLVELGQGRRAEPVLRRAFQLDPTDNQVAMALRSIGVVPGPSLLAEGDLAKPIVPKGPLPQLDPSLRRPASASVSDY